MPDQLAVVLHRQGRFPALVAKQDGRATKDASLVHKQTANDWRLRALTDASCHHRSFITYLRGSDAAPDVLKSAATTMKHLIDTRKPSRIQHLPRCPDITRSRSAEASDVYDRETHDRLAKAAFGDRRD